MTTPCNCPLCRRAAEALVSVAQPHAGAAFVARMALREDLVRLVDGTSPYKVREVLRAAALVGLGGVA